MTRFPKKNRHRAEDDEQRKRSIGGEAPFKGTDADFTHRAPAQGGRESEFYPGISHGQRVDPYPDAQNVFQELMRRLEQEVGEIGQVMDIGAAQMHKPCSERRAKNDDQQGAARQLWLVAQPRDYSEDDANDQGVFTRGKTNGKRDEGEEMSFLQKKEKAQGRQRRGKKVGHVAHFEADDGKRGEQANCDQPGGKAKDGEDPGETVGEQTEGEDT